MKEETPLMKQYHEIKKDYLDSILFFRLGDFYEMLFDDAKTVARELGLTLTARNREKGEEIPLAGVPHHSSAQYIARLVNRGYKVAICEQMEDARQVKGLVKREVVKVISPGTVIDTDYIDEKSNNYLLGLKIGKDAAAIAYLDITTGEFSVADVDNKNIINEINKVMPKEIIIDSVNYEIIKKEIDSYTKNNNIFLNVIDIVEKKDSDSEFYNKIVSFNRGKNCENYLKEYFNVVSLGSYNLENKSESIYIAAFVLEYVRNLHKYNEIPINKINYVDSYEYMELNICTQRNLELMKSSSEASNEGTLVWVLDETKTSMGSRFLKKIIKNPLLKEEEILKRQKDVEFYIDEPIVREEIREKLKKVYDIERLIGKIILGTENGKDINALKMSINGAKEISDLLIENRKIFNNDTIELLDIERLIGETLKDDVPFSIREGGIIKDGYNKELDEYRNISKNGKNFLLELEERERVNTGISNLKIGYNKIFGYYIEITNRNKDNAPSHYIRKQTLANAERFITDELKQYESKILNAKERINELEYYLFKEITAKIKEKTKLLQVLADRISYLDVIVSFAYVAIKNNYVKPEITSENIISIKDGRHPIVEKLVGREEYIKNDTLISEKENFILLTGPNMAGKSTYMKQIALTLIMAQIGSFVPCSSAKLKIVDKIFTRVGASDDILSGQSTFMVEMTETSSILHNATEDSFIILDEIGRGTSTYDGVSIAWAITEYIHDKIKAKTIFATHYHELTELERTLKNLANYRVEVKEIDTGIIFLRKIVKGGADKSYGIEVAKLAGLPEIVLKSSKKILKSLEDRKAIIEKKIEVMQLSLFNKPNEDLEEPPTNEEKLQEKEDEIILKLREIDLNNITPIDALNKLNELKKYLQD
ncbi:MAG: DNA mismatch repair protein MutS [Fusobacteria bacterium]|nr:DNA mismatch repair protein MutS [Fusobacteriota bacterium]